MKSTLKTIFAILLVSTIVMAGIFCYQGVQTANSHCSGDSTSVWCSNFTLHGTIISDAIISTVLTILSIVAVLLIVRTFHDFLPIIKQIVFYIPKTKVRVPILTPIQIAISKGIIHPKIY